MSAQPALDRADALHARIVAAHADYRRSERDLALLLAQMADEKLYLDLGFASVGAYGEKVLDMVPRQVRTFVLIGRSLPDLPALDAAFAEGRLGWTKARELMAVITPDNEAAWVERAEQVTSRELERHVGVAGLDGPPTWEEAAKGPARVRLVFEVDAQDADLLRAAVGMLRAAAGVEEDEISDGVLLAEMARRALHDAKPGEGPTCERYRTVLEHCPSCRRTCGLHADVDPTHVGLARCDGEVLEMRPEHERGRVTRVIPPAIRLAVLHRDEGRCRVWGCTNDLWVDLHHVVERQFGGTHDEDNLITLCTAHHHIIHDGLLAVRRADDGDIEFVFPNGRVLRDPRGSRGESG